MPGTIPTIRVDPGIPGGSAMPLMVGLLQRDIGWGIPSSVCAFLQRSSEHLTSSSPSGKLGRLWIECPPRLGWGAEWAPHPHICPDVPSYSYFLDKDLNYPVSLGPCSGTPDLSTRTPVYFNLLLSLKCFSHSRYRVSAKH